MDMSFEQALGVDDGQGGLESAVHGVTKSHTWLSNWTEHEEIGDQSDGTILYLNFSDGYTTV